MLIVDWSQRGAGYFDSPWSLERNETKKTALLVARWSDMSMRFVAGLVRSVLSSRLIAILGLGESIRTRIVSEPCWPSELRL